MSANAVASGNKSKCLPQVKANHYLKLLSPILFLIAFFAIIQVLLLTTAETSTNGIAILNETTTTTTTPPPSTTKSPGWFDIWKNGDNFLHSSPEVLSQRSRRSQTTTTLAPRQSRLNSSTSASDKLATTTRPQNVTELQIKAPELHVVSESKKAIQVSPMNEPQVDSTIENLAKNDEDDDGDKPETSNLAHQQTEAKKNDQIYKGHNSDNNKLPAGVDIGELVPGSFESLVGADEDLSGANDNDNSDQANHSVESQQQPQASELVLGGHSKHIGPSLETIIHDDKAGDIRAQVGLSLHYQPSHSSTSSVHDTGEPSEDSTSSPAPSGSTDSDGEAVDSDNEQQQNYREAEGRHKPYRSEEQDIGQVIVGAQRHRSLASRPKIPMTMDLNTAAGHYYGKKKKKKMIYKKKKIKKKKKKKVIIIKKKKYMKKKKVKKYKVKKYKKKKFVIIKKKKRKAKKYHHGHHGHHYGHHGGGGGHGHGYGKYYMYAKVPKKKSWEFGFKRGNKKHWIERHEKGQKNKFKTKVKWYDAKSKGKGIHVWDYNHHDKKKKKHYG